MHKKFEKIILLTLFFFVNITSNYAAFGPFVAYNAELYFTPRWGLHLDANWRKVADPLDVQTNHIFVFRAGGLFTLNPKSEKFKTTLSIGAAFRGTIDTSVGIANDLGEVIGKFNTLSQESIIYQQIGFEHKLFKKFTLEHRLRAEQIFNNTVVLDKIAGMKDSTLNYRESRLRYHIRPELTVFRKTDFFSMHVALQEECILRIHQTRVFKTGFIENRLSAHFGVKIKSHTKIELGYMNLIGDPTNLLPSTMNHMLHFQVIQNFNFHKPKKMVNGN